MLNIIISNFINKYSDKQLALLSSLCLLVSFVYTNYSSYFFNNSINNWLQSSVSFVIDKISLPSYNEEEVSPDSNLSGSLELSSVKESNEEFTDIEKVSKFPSLLNQEINIIKPEIQTVDFPIFYNWTDRYQDSKYIDLRLLLIISNYLENKNLSKEEFDKELETILKKNLNQIPDSIYSLRYTTVNYKPEILMKTKILNSSKEEISSILNKWLPFIVYFKKDNQNLRYIIKWETKDKYIVFNAHWNYQEFNKEELVDWKILLLYSNLYE